MDDEKIFAIVVLSILFVGLLLIISFAVGVSMGVEEGYERGYSEGYECGATDLYRLMLGEWQKMQSGVEYEQSTAGDLLPERPYFCQD